MSNLALFTPVGGAQECVWLTPCFAGGGEGVTGYGIPSGTRYTWADIQAGELEKPGGGSDPVASLDPQIEGLHLVRLCDITSGDVVGFVSVTIDETTDTPTTRYFDTVGAPLVAAPANSEICADSIEASNLELVCCVDDTLSDGGTVPVDYVKAYFQTVDNGVLASVLLGSYTDGSLTTAYTPLGVDINPADIGSAARLSQQRIVLVDGGSWTSSPNTVAYSIKVIAGSPDFTDSSGLTTEIFPNESIIFNAESAGVTLFNNIVTVTAGAGDTVTIDYSNIV